MAAAERVDHRIEPFFIEGSAGRLFWTLFTPARGPASGVSCIVLPPFAEEMNKSRRMLSLQARRLADHGCTVLLPDLYGTGDSGGSFADASVSVWLEDSVLMLRFLADRGMHTVNMLAVRAGSLLCGPVLERYPPGLGADNIVLWQPYTSGNTLVREFLRLRVAADMARNEASSTGALMTEARTSGSVEVAGYALTDALISGLSELKFSVPSRPAEVDVGWVEMSLSETPGLRGASRRVIAELRGLGHSVTEIPLRCPPFWSATEIVESRVVLDSTTKQFIDGSENAGA